MSKKDAVEDKDEILEKYRHAGAILADVHSAARERTVKGTSMLELAEYLENMIRERGASPAFPCNISLNEDAAHDTPKADDTRTIGEDMVKIDIGVHIDGYIADAAITVDHTGNTDIVRASEDALGAAIEIVRDGVNTAEIGEVIEQTMHNYRCNPVVNLTGHGLQQYVQHAPPQIPNRKVDHGTILRTGDIVAIEPFATNGVGKISEHGSAEIYSVKKSKPVRLPAARELLKKLEEYHGLPFAKRWIKMERLDHSLIQLERAGVLQAYPVLREVSGGTISQAEHTMIVLEGGCEVITAERV